MELSSSNINKFLIFSQKKTFLIFQEMETLKKLPMFSQKKRVLIFWKTKTLKNSLYFRRRNFLIFHEEVPKSEKKQNLLYFSKISYE